MTAIRGLAMSCALVGSALAIGGVRAGEVEGDLMCRGCGPSRSFYVAPAVSLQVRSYYEPCEPVGPVRRFLRRVFRPCCPPPCRPAVAVVPAPIYTPAPVAYPVPAPAPVFSAPIAPTTPPPATLDRPLVPTAPFPSAAAPEVPGSNSSLRREGQMPLPPLPPVRADRIASREGTGTSHLVARAKLDTPEVLLVHAERREIQKRARADEQGRFSVELTVGEWQVYRLEAGKTKWQGKLRVTEAGVVTARLPE